MQTNSTDGSVHFEGGPFGSLNPPDINNPKRGTPNPEKKSGSGYMISSILSDVEIVAEFTGEMTSEIRAIGLMAAISPENSMRGPLQD